MRILAVLWLLFISVLFFLPGSTLPQGGLFSIPYFDKYVHVGFFAVLVFLWRFYFGPDVKFTGLVLLLALCYGMAVEVVQHYWVVNRSFDLGDVLADLSGAVLGIVLWTKRSIKK